MGADPLAQRGLLAAVSGEVGTQVHAVQFSDTLNVWQAPRSLPLLAHRYEIPPVTTIEEIRRANLKALLAGFRPERKFAELIGRTQAQVTQWKNASPDSKTGKPRQLSSELCRVIEQRCGKPEGWMDQQHWTGAQHAPEGAVSLTDPLDRLLSHPQRDDAPTTLKWESIVQLKELPDRFRLAVPDDALAPNTPRGVVLIFSRDIEASVGAGVLVEDEATGQRYIRMYAEGPGGSWVAAARAEGYISLSSQHHRLRVLAVVEAKVDSRV